MTKARSLRRSSKEARAPILDIEVTREIIDAAMRQNSRYCMIAEAIKAQYPQFTHVSVDLQTIRFSNAIRGLRHAYLTPRLCQLALVNFDQGNRLRPFKFKLRGAHTTAMIRTNRQKGKPLRERMRLGRRRMVGDPNSAHSVPETIGGKPMPRPSKPWYPSSEMREFGMRVLGNPNDVLAKE